MRKFALRGLALALSCLLLAVPALAASDMTGTVNTDTLRLRAEPSLSGEVLALLSNGTDVSISKSAPLVNDSGTWYKVRYKDKTGYMAADFLDVSGGVINARVTVSAERLNFRGAPSTSSEILMVLPKGATARIAGDEGGGWYKSEYDGVTGYIKSNFISFSGTSEGKTESVSGKYGKVTSSRVNFRAEASLSAAVKSVLPIGTILTLKGKEDDWYSASYNGVKGYVRADFVKVTSEKPNETVGVEMKKARSDGNGSGSGSSLVETALSKIGSPYVYGSSGPKTFDCSGFTSWVYRQHGIRLNRTALDQYRLDGSKVSSVSALQPGDLVFIRDPHVSRNAVSHVGIYAGNGRMVHAGSGRNDGGGRVKLSSLVEGYYRNYFVAGKRVS